MKKRIVVAETRAARNKAIRSKVKTFVKKVEAAITAGDKAAAQAALLAATTILFFADLMLANLYTSILF